MKLLSQVRPAILVWHYSRRVGLEQALAVPGAHVHLYGKLACSPGRKMGHVTALGATPAAALATARAAADHIRFGGGYVTH